MPRSSPRCCTLPSTSWRPPWASLSARQRPRLRPPEASCRAGLPSSRLGRRTPMLLGAGESRRLCAAEMLHAGCNVKALARLFSPGSEARAPWKRGWAPRRLPLRRPRLLSPVLQMTRRLPVTSEGPGVSGTASVGTRRLISSVTSLLLTALFPLPWKQVLVMSDSHVHYSAARKGALHPLASCTGTCGNLAHMQALCVTQLMLDFTLKVTALQEVICIL